MPPTDDGFLQHDDVLAHDDVLSIGAPRRDGYLYAFTAPGPDMPEFVNFTAVDGKLRVLVRGPKKPTIVRAPGEPDDGRGYATYGDTAAATIDVEEAKKLHAALGDWLAATEV